jgi:hypothetical protein
LATLHDFLTGFRPNSNAVNACPCIREHLELPYALTYFWNHVLQLFWIYSAVMKVETLRTRGRNPKMQKNIQNKNALKNNTDKSHIYNVKILL